VDKFAHPASNDLIASAQVCLSNASATLDDARFLLGGERFNRAFALAILAQEECAKCFMLCTCTLQPRWDVAIWKALRQHEHKQALVEVMERYVNWFAQHNAFALRLNESALIQAPISYTPQPDEFATWRSEVRKSVIDKGSVDRAKQQALYVAIGKNGKVSSTPSCTREQAVAQLQKATTFQQVASNQLKHVARCAAGVGA